MRGWRGGCVHFALQECRRNWLNMDWPTQVVRANKIACVLQKIPHARGTHWHMGTATVYLATHVYLCTGVAGRSLMAAMRLQQQHPPSDSRLRISPKRTSFAARSMQLSAVLKWLHTHGSSLPGGAPRGQLVCGGANSRYRVPGPGS